uniref:Uncharacterized protein n=1 Tax=Anguilla anguilla TaxID=7936 RepID=A0A0E9SVI7_ANGAN
MKEEQELPVCIIVVVQLHIFEEIICLVLS